MGAENDLVAIGGARAVHISSQGKQDYVTPLWFIKACEERFGVRLILDLAASSDNTRCGRYFTEGRDSLQSDWRMGLAAACLSTGDSAKSAAAWLNPEFRKTPAFMERCKLWSEEGDVKIITLTLSSLGTAWYKKSVKPCALSLILEDRITFEGCDDPYPKELMVSLFGFGLTGLGWWKQGKGSP